MLTKPRFNVNGIINFLMILLICSFTLLTNYWWGKYFMLGCCGLIFCLQLLRDGITPKISIGVFPTIIGLFALYTAASASWAEQASDSLSMARTLFEILIMMFILYHCYCNNQNGVTNILGCIKWASYIISIYSILFYGFEFLLTLSETEERLEGTFANVNTIGMLAAIGIIVQLEQIFREKKWKWASLFCIPSIFIVAVTQSRKALLILLLGTLLSLLFHNFNSKSLFRTIIKLAVILLIVVFLLNLLLSLPIFAGIVERTNQFIASITGEGTVDSSTENRNDLLEIGWDQFLKTPVLGMGMSNAHILSNIYLGDDSYLHNNFIELLAGGGIVGFAIFYSMYVYLLAMFWKFRKCRNKEYFICLIMTIILLVLDYGMVSYYQKMSYIYRLLIFLEIEALKKQAQLPELRAVSSR